VSFSLLTISVIQSWVLKKCWCTPAATLTGLLRAERSGDHSLYYIPVYHYSSSLIITVKVSSETRFVSYFATLVAKRVSLLLRN
jgi:hypothetical protein